MSSPTTGSILLVDDEQKLLTLLARALRDEGHEVVEASRPREAQALLGERMFDVLVVDNLMPDMTGLDLIREVVSSAPKSERPQILMMTAHATIESAIEAMKLGALDYLQKPFEVEELVVVVRRALEHERLQTQHRYLINERQEAFNSYGIIGRSRQMQDVIRTAELVAQSKSTVLITGETGTGKELVAHAIHSHSAQQEMPLIKVNCAAIPEGLLESELFGHVRGAFTGAVSNKRGRFALADGGSIFLDEVGTMALGRFRPSCFGCFRSASSNRWARSGPTVSMSGSWRRRIATCRRWSRTNDFSKTCFIGSTSSRSRFRPFATGERIFRSSSTISCANMRDRPVRSSVDWRTVGWRYCRTTTGLAMCVSLKASSNVPSS